MEETIFVETNVTINQLLEVEQYPVPKPSDLISAILWGGGSSKLDLAWAYHQIVLKEETRKLFQRTWDFSATPGCLLRWHQTPAIFNESLALTAMAKYSCRFCRAIFETNVSDSGACPLQVA